MPRMGEALPGRHLSEPAPQAGAARENLSALRQQAGS